MGDSYLAGLAYKTTIYRYMYLRLNAYLQVQILSIVTCLLSIVFTASIAHIVKLWLRINSKYPKLENNTTQTTQSIVSIQCILETSY